MAFGNGINQRAKCTETREENEKASKNVDMQICCSSGGVAFPWDITDSSRQTLAKGFQIICWFRIISFLKTYKSLFLASLNDFQGRYRSFGKVPRETCYCCTIVFALCFAPAIAKEAHNSYFLMKC